MGRFILVNLFSWRVTNPRELRAAAAAGHDITGSANDQVIADAVQGAAVVVAAWGHLDVLVAVATTMCSWASHGPLRRRGEGRSRRTLSVAMSSWLTFVRY